MAVRCLAFSLDQPDDVVAALAPTLDDHERAAAAKRRGKVARNRSVVAHGVRRALLGDALGRAPDEVRIDRRCRHCGDPGHGKPAVADAGDCSFSLSHSRAVGVLAIGIGVGAVGVDVEVGRPRRHLARLAERVCTPDEYARWLAAPADARLDAFLRIWTAKEAYLKATGYGLTRPLRTVPVAPAGWHLSAPELPAGPELPAEVVTDGAGAVLGLAVETERSAPPPVATWTSARGVTLDRAW